MTQKQDMLIPARVNHYDFEFLLSLETAGCNVSVIDC